MSLWDAYREKFGKKPNNKPAKPKPTANKSGLDSGVKSKGKAKNKTTPQDAPKDALPSDKPKSKSLNAKNPHEGHRQRMRERYEKDPDMDTFAPHEVLELFLYNGIPQKDTNRLAHDLINTFGSFNNVFDAPKEDLLAVKGMTKNAVMMIKETLAIASIYHRHLNAHRVELSNPYQVAEYVKSYFLNKTYEMVYALFLDINSKLITTIDVGKGNATSTGIDVKKLSSMARAKRAVKIVLVHKHPGVNFLPSPNDINTTFSLIFYIYLYDMNLIDHIIIGPDGRFFSFEENGLIQELTKRCNAFMSMKDSKLAEIKLTNDLSSKATIEDLTTIAERFTESNSKIGRTTPI